ncbi:hypothetical protein SDC9_143199 [bioreactor metagenome]|uniref:Uncharacterized protein n=1 Tax=bioreactor metagenome TaxID=1076179 RepID=A0A645E5G0_9ZZZZ
MQHPVNALVYYRVVIYSGIVPTVRSVVDEYRSARNIQNTVHAARRILYGCCAVFKEDLTKHLSVRVNASILHA